MSELKIIDRKIMSKGEIEKHFFRQGYEYSLLHFSIAVEKLKINDGLATRIRKEYLNFFEVKK